MLVEVSAIKSIGPWVPLLTATSPITGLAIGVHAHCRGDLVRGRIRSVRCQRNLSGDRTASAAVHSAGLLVLRQVQDLAIRDTWSGSAAVRRGKAGRHCLQMLGNNISK
jgi:hypothetical protein